LFRKRWGDGKFSLKIFRRPPYRFSFFYQLIVR
jgi:hypothetical protein